MRVPSHLRTPPRFGRRQVLSLAGAGLVAGLGGRRAEALCGIYPTVESLEFRIEQAGRDVGRHRVAFLRESGDLLAYSEHEVIQGPHRRVRQRVEEGWRDGWLVDLRADTWWNGSHRSLRAARLDGPNAHGGGLAGQAGSLRFNVSGYVIPTTFWHRDIPFSQAVLSVVDGLVKIVSSRRLPDGRLPFAGRQVDVRGWELRGEWPCRLWYDADCLLAQVMQADEEGRILLFRREA